MQNVLKEYFPSLAEASDFFRDALPCIIANTYLEVCGIFTQKEIILIITVMRDVTLVPTAAGSVLLQECLDYIRFNMAAVSTLIDVHDFIHKLNSLTSFQTLYLELWAQRYWDDEETPIQVYASTLLNKKSVIHQ